MVAVEQNIVEADQLLSYEIFLLPHGALWGIFLNLKLKFFSYMRQLVVSCYLYTFVYHTVSGALNMIIIVDEQLCLFVWTM